jgi:hypothetical protein
MDVKLLILDDKNEITIIPWTCELVLDCGFFQIEIIHTFLL